MEIFLFFPPLPGGRVKLFPAQSPTFYLAREVHQTLLPPDTREDPHQTLRPQSHLHLSIYISLVKCFIKRVCCFQLHLVNVTIHLWDFCPIFMCVAIQSYHGGWQYLAGEKGVCDGWCSLEGHVNIVAGPNEWVSQNEHAHPPNLTTHLS